MDIPAFDLKSRAPRSPRVRLGGYVILPRILDKGRSTVVGKNGEYTYNCPLDQRFFEFAGVDAEALKQQLAAGLGDGEILHWVSNHSKNHPTPGDIAAWSALAEERAPSDVESREYFNGLHKNVAPHREDVATWFDLLDVDDYASYGGRV